MRPTCAQCVWWAADKTECRISAPGMQLWPSKNGDNWPKTEATDWCKEHVLKQEFIPCSKCGKVVGNRPFLFQYSLARDGSFSGNPIYCCSPNCAEQAELDKREHYRKNAVFQVTNTNIEQVNL